MSKDRPMRCHSVKFDDPTAEILDNRESRYGRFATQAATAQALKDALNQVAVERQTDTFSPDMLEALDLICTKLSRIVHGDPALLDSWDDVAGYARLVADRLRGGCHV